MNNHNKITQKSLFYHSLKQLKEATTNGVVRLNHNGRMVSLTILSEEQTKMTLRAKSGKIYNVISK